MKSFVVVVTSNLADDDVCEVSGPFGSRKEARAFAIRDAEAFFKKGNVQIERLRFQKERTGAMVFSEDGMRMIWKVMILRQVSRLES